MLDFPTSKRIFCVTFSNKILALSSLLSKISFCCIATESDLNIVFVLSGINIPIVEEFLFVNSKLRPVNTSPSKNALILNSI